MCPDRTRGWRLLRIFLAGAALWTPANAQSPTADDPEDRVRAAMEESLNQQRESVRVQLEAQRTRQVVAKPRPLPPLAAPLPVVYSTPPAFQANCPPLSAELLREQIDLAAAENGLSPDLLRAIARVESGFIPCAVSPKGAAGLMQIMPGTGRELGLEDPLDSKQSLAAGAKYLSQLLLRYGGDLRLALSAYNAGPGRVDQYGDIPPIEETQNYVRKILSEYNVPEQIR